MVYCIHINELVEVDVNYPNTFVQISYVHYMNGNVAENVILYLYIILCILYIIDIICLYII